MHHPLGDVQPPPAAFAAGVMAAQPQVLGRRAQRVKRQAGHGAETGVANLAAQVSSAQAGDPATPVVIAADRNVKYESVVKAMDVLQRAGIQRVGLSVKSSAAP